MTDTFIPRSIYQMVEFFEDLLFMHTENFDDVGAPPDGMLLCDAGVELLGTLGVTGRIFRRWYQTTWGWNHSSKWFDGETPRMEIARRDNGLVRGDTYIGAQLMRDEARSAKVMPAVYEKGEIDAARGVFALGKSFLPKSVEARNLFRSLPAPNFDPSFKSFVTNMEEFEADIKREKIETLPLDIEERNWHVFWGDVWMTILLNCDIQLPRRNLIEIGAIMRLIVERMIREQGTGSDDYIPFDYLCRMFWDVILEFDAQLLPLKKIQVSDHDGISKLIRTPDGIYSLQVYYNLTNILDELFLFPADRYFGAVECVWTDQMSFMNDLAMTIALLNNDLKPLPCEGNINSRSEKVQKSHWYRGESYGYLSNLVFSTDMF